jgi:hypothetical protein
LSGNISFSPEKTCLPHDSEKLEIISPGVHNHNQGPDFLNAKIRIGETLWVGNVEIHIDAEDWFNHKHHNDPKYGNVILHVVYGNLSHKKYPKHLPHFVLDNYIKPETLDTYYGLMHSASWIPCISQIQQIDAQTKDFLERKTGGGKARRKVPHELKKSSSATTGTGSKLFLNT